ncbi:hypothetical protein EZS27_024771 [termite gut metagenome]|uniref:ISXO2-like transposase domain-containing protein n=1 Tax=termite gut metagenome TaxID=433724 RepID=A0A5J4R026_9ZZZZ
MVKKRVSQTEGKAIKSGSLWHLRLLMGGYRAYARVIEDACAKSFKPFFKSHIAKDAHIVTDEWNGYKPLKKEYPNLDRVKLDKGNGLPDLHLHIMNIKGWLRRIHHHVSKERLQVYLDEYHFRFNRGNNMDTIFDLFIKRMVKNEPKT